ncbi:MAG: metallophosphoesterase, partial [Pseudopedobacter sp.]|nr:metallophosphoesterase [Deinococcales bacterium]
MRYLLLSDIHANSPALEAVLWDAFGRNVDRVISLGDALGYGPFPMEVLARL